MKLWNFNKSKKAEQAPKTFVLLDEQEAREIDNKSSKWAGIFAAIFLLGGAGILHIFTPNLDELAVGVGMAYCGFAMFLYLYMVRAIFKVRGVQGKLAREKKSAEAGNIQN